MQDGSGSFAGGLAAGAIGLVQFAAAQLTKRWVIGVLSDDEEPWGGRRCFHRERVEEKYLPARMDELAVHVESGRITVPLRRDRRLRRKTITGTGTRP
ncbi:hypothetical protein [Allobranchiibius sp. GilTou73]|uniref:hypothetical protein n=1 Tax=Allobranchiibius sp. GilTou73 TaxID=2904523 RepID=UPI001F16AEA1|nr:hypothetical protein [Allobranchiibius sp. GilTou73]UIJ35486.1 hypothetical protein LVQ62_03595 [Allobranchiibius sp. GilTou73]